MYCAVLNDARTRLFRRTTSWEIDPVTSAISIGQGGSNNITDAKNGTKLTDEPRRAPEMRGTGRNEESATIPKIVNAMIPFQNPVSANDGRYHCHGPVRKRAAAAAPTAASRILKLHRSS